MLRWMRLNYGMNRLFTVYIHISPSWKYYVGLTSAKNVTSRWGKNGNGYKTQYFNRAIEKYGWENFIHLIVRGNLIKKEASSLEKLLIEQLKSNESKYGYNISYGGECTTLGLHLTEESCKKISDRFSVPVDQYNKNGELIKTWNSMTEAEVEESFDRSAIAKCCKGAYKTSKEYVWRYAGESFNKYSIEKYQQPKRRIKVKQFSPNGNLIHIWDSISDAARYMNTNTSSITDCCRGKKGRKIVNGFIWRYLNDDFDKYNIKNEKYTPVCQFDLNGDFLQDFDTIHDASCYTSISSSNIISCCNNSTKKAGGYLWKYKKEWVFEKQKQKRI